MSEPQTQVSSQTELQETSTENQMKSSRKNRKRRWIIVSLIAVLLAYSLIDLFGPRSKNLRDFDPNEVARLETAMWRSYYNRERLRLFNQLSELMRTEYDLPFIRSNVVAYQAARAAFVFKDGHNRDEYEKALPNLINFYTAIRKVSDTPFDIDRAARLELEWWIVHRERKNHTAGDLDRALADLASEVYRVPADQLMEHARLRAEAMTIRDDKAEAGGVSEQDWARIDELLHQSWKSLWEAVN